MKRVLAFAVATALIVAYPAGGILCKTAFAAEPLASGIDLTNFDKSVRPQDDLFRAVNGAWLAKAKIPADRSSYGAFMALAEQAEKDLRAIIEACADAKDNPPGSERQKIGDMYASYMNETRAEQLGIEPIAGMLAAIDRIETKADLVRSLAELDRVGVSGAVGCYVNTDAKKSDQYILYLSQAGLGLPDRDYYWDAKFKTKLAAYGQARRAHAVAGESSRRQAGRGGYRGLRDPTGQSPVVEAGEPRQHQDLQQEDSRRACRARSRVRLEPVLCHARRQERPRVHRRAAVVLHRHGGDGRLGAVGHLEGVAEVASDPTSTQVC